MRKISLYLSFCLLVLVVVLLYSCGKEPQFIGLKNAKITGLQDSLLLFDLDYVAYNPNNIKTQLKSSDVAIYYRNQWVGSGSISHGLSLPANDTITAAVNCRVSLYQLHKFYPELMASDSAVFELRGFNKIGLSLLNIYNKVDQQIRLNTKSYFEEEVRKILNSQKSFSIQKLSIYSLPRLSESEFALEVLIQNTLPFDYILEDLNLKILSEGNSESLAAWQLSEPLTQKAKSETALPVRVKVNHLNMIKNAKLSWLQTQSAKLRVTGTMKILIAGKSFEIPVNDMVAIAL